jgi:hypothetical protein
MALSFVLDSAVTPTHQDNKMAGYQRQMRTVAADAEMSAANDQMGARSTSQFGSNQDRMAGLTGAASVDSGAEMQVEWGAFAIPMLAPTEQTNDGPPSLFVAFTRTEPADAAGHTVDLAGVSQIDNNTLYVKIDAGGTMWLHIGLLDSTDKAQLVEWLQAAEGNVSLSSKGRLVLGVPSEHLHLSADTEEPQKVLDDAIARSSEGGLVEEQARLNKQLDSGAINDEEFDRASSAARLDAAIFEFVNGGETVLEKEGANHDGWKDDQEKPGSWYNGYYIDAKGQVQAHKSPTYDQRDASAPSLDLDGLKALIMRCMNVGGIKEALGDDRATFVAAINARFAEGHPLGSKGLESLSLEMWSYLQTGAGIDKKVDIGKLQACMHAISPDTKATSDSNNEFTGKSFTPAGSKGELKRGDGLFGRATMLSLMHLVGEFSRTIEPLPDIGLVPGGLFDDNDVFIHDRSGSMMGTSQKWPNVRNAVDKSQGWGPGNGLNSRSAGDFSITNVRMDGKRMTDMRESLVLAYEELYPDNRRTDRTAFAALFGITDHKDIFDGRKLNARSLMLTIGDGSGGNFGARGESSLKAMLMVLTHPDDLGPNMGSLRDRIKGGEDDYKKTNMKPVRLNAVADEPEQSLEYLDLVRALANHLHVDARIIAVPTDENTDYQANPVGNLIFIDLDSIDIHPDNKAATWKYVQGGVEKEAKGVTIDKPGPGGRPFKGASLKLNEKQNGEGVNE